MIEQLNECIRQAANQSGIPTVYFGRIGDFSIVNNAAINVPALVIEPPSASSIAIKAIALQDDYTFKLYLLDQDKTDSGFDALLENQATVPAREVTITAMDAVMRDFIWYLTKAVIDIGQRVVSPSGLISYDQYTDKVLAGVSRSVTIRTVTTNPQCN